MKYPEKNCIVEVKRKSPEAQWSKALFYRNGGVPTFAQYGSPVFDVVEWRHIKPQKGA